MHPIFGGRTNDPVPKERIHKLKIPDVKEP